MTVIEQEFYFDGLNRRQGKCHLRLFSRLAVEQQARPIHDDEDTATRQVIVLATEVEDNPGASITNAAEKLAAQVCEHFAIRPSRLVWVEHYDERDLPRHQWASYRPEGESYDLVSFDFRSARQIHDGGGISLGKPTWKHTTKADIEKLIGEKLP